MNFAQESPEELLRQSFEDIKALVGKAAAINDTSMLSRLVFYQFR